MRSVLWYKREDWKMHSSMFLRRSRDPQAARRVLKEYQEDLVCLDEPARDTLRKRLQGLGIGYSPARLDRILFYATKNVGAAGYASGPRAKPGEEAVPWQENAIRLLEEA
jgi:hypothetical protein